MVAVRRARHQSGLEAPKIVKLHEVPEIKQVIDQGGILLDYASEPLRVFKCDGQLLVERVVVPIHLCQAENS
tara:strand:+ start:469 stop:684 length:216 start_codon:yes stop_codon:yes gene_type:complete